MSFIGLPSVLHRSNWKKPLQTVVMTAPMISGTNIVPAGTLCSVFHILTFFLDFIPDAPFAFL